VLSRIPRRPVCTFHVLACSQGVNLSQTSAQVCCTDKAAGPYSHFSEGIGREHQPNRQSVGLSAKVAWLAQSKGLYNGSGTCCCATSQNVCMLRNSMWRLCNKRSSITVCQSYTKNAMKEGGTGPHRFSCKHLLHNACNGCCSHTVMMRSEKNLPLPRGGRPW
jgi:hypothetical protein